MGSGLTELLIDTTWRRLSIFILVFLGRTAKYCRHTVRRDDLNFHGSGARSFGLLWVTGAENEMLVDIGPFSSFPTFLTVAGGNFPGYSTAGQRSSALPCTYQGSENGFRTTSIASTSSLSLENTYFVATRWLLNTHAQLHLGSQIFEQYEPSGVEHNGEFGGRLCKTETH